MVTREPKHLIILMELFGLVFIFFGVFCYHYAKQCTHLVFVIMLLFVLILILTGIGIIVYGLVILLTIWCIDSFFNFLEIIATLIPKVANHIKQNWKLKKIKRKSV